MQAAYIVITPARDESEYIQRTIESLTAQTIRPREWIIVDDGSTDETAAIVQRAIADYPWIRLVQVMDRGERVVGAGVVDAFNSGLAAVSRSDFDFLCKLDADLVLSPSYFERLLSYFDADPKLGLAGGRVREKLDDGFQTLRNEPEMVFGSVKFYRRVCFDAIGGLEKSIGWDGIDCYQAMRRGWRTATIEDSELDVLHLRRMGTSHKNIFHGCARRGRGLYYNRSHPLWVLASALYHMLDRPYVATGLCILWGYIDSAIKRTPRIADEEFAVFLRSWQLRKLKRATKSFVLRRSDNHPQPLAGDPS